MSVKAADLSQDFITDNHIRAALKVDKGNDAHLNSWTVENFTKKGDNFSCRVTSTRISYRIGKTDHNISYVVKVNPRRNMGAHLDPWRFFFRKEVRFHREITPKLNSVLQKAGLESLRIPQCFHTCLESEREIIIMEDLRPQGFKTFDRKKGFDVAHTTLVLQELAKLHAASLMLQGHSDNDVNKLLRDVFGEEWFNFSGNAREFSTSVFRGGVENAIAVLEHVPGYERAIHWLENLRSSVLEALEDQTRKCKPFVVLCHGDCWTSNLLFRYDGNGVPVEAALVDLQMVFFASPAIDLNYLLNISLDAADRRNKKDEYLDIYHHALKQAMEAGGSCIPFSRQQLQQEYKDKNLYGLLFALLLIPVAVANEKEAPDLDDLDGDVVDNFVHKQKRKMVEMLETNPLFRPRYLGLFDEMMECELIP